METSRKQIQDYEAVLLQREGLIQELHAEAEIHHRQLNQLAQLQIELSSAKEMTEVSHFNRMILADIIYIISRCMYIIEVIYRGPSTLSGVFLCSFSFCRQRMNWHGNRWRKVRDCCAVTYRASEKET